MRASPAGRVVWYDRRVNASRTLLVLASLAATACDAGRATLVPMDGAFADASVDSGGDAGGDAGPSMGFAAEPPFRYFHNRAVDARVATTKAVPVSDLPATLVGYLDRALVSIDLATFQFSDASIAAALLRAHARGVRVRLVMDADYVTQAASNLAMFDAVGIGHLADDANGQPSSALMHDKFLVMDGELVFTGSYNLTPSGATDDRQDVLVIHDALVAAAYTAHFEQMWGSTTATPDALVAAFHNRKVDLGAHVFDVAGRTVEVWFSPADDRANGGPMTHLIQAVATADTSIDFHIFVFSEQLLADAMKARFDLGVAVRGVFDSHYWDAAYSESIDLRGLGTPGPDSAPWSPPAYVFELNEVQFLHAKSMVIDASDVSSHPTVEIGSFNWSASANDANDENLVIVRDDAELANQLLQAVCGSVLAAGGSCVP